MPSSAVLRVVLLSFHPSLLSPSTSFPWNRVPRERFRPRGASPVRQQGSTRCTESRSGEIASWAGDTPTMTPLKESGSRSPAFLIANPERSSGDIFRELQRLSPGRYQPLRIHTLQRGMRKIRAHLLETFEQQWQEEAIR